MPKRIDWEKVGWGFMGMLASSGQTPDTVQNRTNGQDGNMGKQPPVSTPADKWRLEYRLKSTNYLDDPTIIFKFGGSAWRQESWQQIIEVRIQQLKELHRRYPVVVTTGGGRVQEISKDMYERLGISEATYRESAGRALATQAQTLADLLGDKGLYIEPDALRYITSGMLKERIPVVSLLGKDYLDFVEIEENGRKRHVNSIPEDQSDAHTNIIGHYLGQRGAVYAKATDGIWVVDPNVKPEDGEIYTRLQAELKRLGHERNVMVPSLKATDVLEGKIIRTGKDNRSQHLAETLGLRLYLNPESTVQSLQVIDINNPEHVRRAFEGYAKGRYNIGSTITKG